MYSMYSIVFSMYSMYSIVYSMYDIECILSIPPLYREIVIECLLQFMNGSVFIYVD